MKNKSKKSPFKRDTQLRIGYGINPDDIVSKSEYNKRLEQIARLRDAVSKQNNLLVFLWNEYAYRKDERKDKSFREVCAWAREVDEAAEKAARVQ